MRVQKKVRVGQHSSELIRGFIEDFFIHLAIAPAGRLTVECLVIVFYLSTAGVSNETS